MNDLYVDNYTVLCTTYIPDTVEYRDALGWLWFLFLAVGSVTCALLYGLFLKQVISAIDNDHVVFRNSVIWIASLYPFMALMTIIGFVVPRSQEICYTVKVFYMTIAISKFADLTLLMYGSEEVMLWTLRKSVLKMNVGPVCCFCFCLPKAVSITKLRLRTIIAGVQQLPFSQSFYLVMVLILQAANQIVVGSLDPRGSYVWLNLFSVITSLSGVYCLNLLSTVSEEHLKRYMYSNLSFVMKALIIVTKLQALVFNILALYEVFPCVPPISHHVYRETVENCLYIVEMLVFGLHSYKMYHKVRFDTANPVIIRTDHKGNSVPLHHAYLPSLSGLTEEPGANYPGVDYLDNRASMNEHWEAEGANSSNAANDNIRDVYDPLDSLTAMSRNQEIQGAKFANSSQEKSKTVYDFSGLGLVTQDEEVPGAKNNYQRFE